MSFILDALRKSEHARQHLGGATLAELPLGRRTRGQPWWVFALAALLIVNLIVLTIVLLRKDSQPAPNAQLPATPMNRLASAAPPTTNPAPPVSLADEAAPAPNVQYETIPRDESPLAINTPDGPTLVKRIDGAAATDTNAPDASTANGLPALRLDMHVYAKNPKDRFVLINMRKYTEGQLLTEGPRIGEITADGVILFYQGQSLRLQPP